MAHLLSALSLAHLAHPRGRLASASEDTEQPAYTLNADGAASLYAKLARIHAGSVGLGLAHGEMFSFTLQPVCIPSTNPTAYRHQETRSRTALVTTTLTAQARPLQAGIKPFGSTGRRIKTHTSLASHPATAWHTPPPLHPQQQNHWQPGPGIAQALQLLCSPMLQASQACASMQASFHAALSHLADAAAAGLHSHTSDHHHFHGTELTSPSLAVRLSSWVPLPRLCPDGAQCGGAGEAVILNWLVHYPEAVPHAVISPHHTPVVLDSTAGAHDEVVLQQMLPSTTSKDMQLWDAFKEMDTDGDGVLSASELSQALERLGLPCTKEYLEEMLSQFDEKHSGNISFAGYLGYVQQREGEMERAFREFDVDGTGEVSVAALAGAIQATHLPTHVARPSQVKYMVGLLDADGSNTISYAEFRRFASLLPSSQLASACHVLHCWANSSMWHQVMATESEVSEGEDAGRGQNPMVMAAGGHHAAAAAAARQITSPNEALNRLMVGGVAGVLSRTLIAPLERLRTLIMLSKVPMSFTTAAKLMWADGGLGGLWKGHMSTVLKVFPTSAITFGVVSSCKQALQELKGGAPLTELDCFLSGCAAGAVSCVVSHPLDTIRTQMAVAVGRGPGIMSVARTIGLAGLYRGFGLSCLMEVLGNGLGFLAVDKACGMFNQTHQRQPNAQERGMLAAACAMFVISCIMPLDVVVRRIQAAGVPGHPVYAGPVAAFRCILASEGPRAFYRGLFTSYLKAAPSMGAIYYSYDTLSKLTGVGGLNRFRPAMGMSV